MSRDNILHKVRTALGRSEGQGVADGLFGVTPFTGRLSFDWPRSMEQLPAPIEDPLFPFGYGLSTDD